MLPAAVRKRRTAAEVFTVAEAVASTYDAGTKFHEAMKGLWGCDTNAYALPAATGAPK